MRSGASRKSRALRVGRGVHHDQVVVALGVDLEEALHGDVVVALDEARPRCSGRAGWPGSRRGCARRGRAAGSGRPTTPWCRAWPPTARPGASRPRPRKASSGTRRSVLPIPSSPSASARRRAGSTVSTRTLPPRWAAAMAAAAAAVVVLPTPPGPQATTISLEASRPSSDAPASRGAPAARRGVTTPSSSPSERGHLADRAQPVEAGEEERAGTARARRGRSLPAAARGARRGCAAG